VWPPRRRREARVRPPAVLDPDVADPAAVALALLLLQRLDELVARQQLVVQREAAEEVDVGAHAGSRRRGTSMCGGTVSSLDHGAASGQNPEPAGTARHAS